MSWFKKESRNGAMPGMNYLRMPRHLIFRDPFILCPGSNLGGFTDVTLLGDAAHLMPPFAGEGVNMAMLDALELSEQLDLSELQKSIAAYEKQMRKRASEAVQASLENTEWMHSENALKLMLDMFNRQ